MKLTTFLAVLSAAAIPVALAANLTINTPSNVVECEPTQFQWSGGVEPYYLSLVPAEQISAAAVSETKQFPTQTGTSYTWLVDLASGTSLTAVLKDSTGAAAYSDIITIIAGSSSSCLNNSVQETGGSSASSSASATGTAAGSSSSGTATASGSSSTHSSAAGRLGVSSAFGVAGVMGLVGAALF